jgi:hypothetical protein
MYEYTLYKVPYAGRFFVSLWKMFGNKHGRAVQWWYLGRGRITHISCPLLHIFISLHPSSPHKLDTVCGGGGRLSEPRVQIQKEVISGLKRKNQFFLSKEICGVCMIDLKREICKPVLKIGFTASWHNGVPVGIWTPGMTTCMIFRVFWKPNQTIFRGFSLIASRAGPIGRGPSWICNRNNI